MGSPQAGLTFAFDAFREGLRELGWTENENIAIETDGRGRVLTGSWPHFKSPALTGLHAGGGFRYVSGWSSHSRSLDVTPTQIAKIVDVARPLTNTGNS